MEKFRKLGIIEPILKSIQEQKFEEPSEIQEKSIPLILDWKDIIAKAATGSGKTLAFAAAIIKNVDRGKGVQALVLTPTRELAEQVFKVIQKFSKYKPLNITSIYGGVSINPQIDKLRTTDVVVGTPGRILDHMDRRTFNLEKIKILVLDEADRMLDMGFKNDVERIIWKCPKERQTLLFSATISTELVELAKKYMKNPIRVSAEAYVDASKLTQNYYNIEDNKKFSLLVHFLKHEKSGLVMIFCNTKRNTDFVANNLKDHGIRAMAIHGGHSQEKRSSTMYKFHEQQISVLVCTDVAARGLDIKGVSHIYNYDIPKTSDEYIHRIGRTARAGKDGKVINILTSRDYDNFQAVLRNRDLNIERMPVPPIEHIYIQAKETPRRGGNRNFRQNRHQDGRNDNYFPRHNDHRENRNSFGENRYQTSEDSRSARKSREDRSGGFRRGKITNLKR